MVIVVVILVIFDTLTAALITKGFLLPHVSFGGNPQDPGAIMEIGSSFTHRHSLAPFLMVRNAAPLHPPGTFPINHLLCSSYYYYYYDVLLLIYSVANSDIVFPAFLFLGGKAGTSASDPIELDLTRSESTTSTTRSDSSMWLKRNV